MGKDPQEQPPTGADASPPAPLRPAATLVLLRDGAADMEVLLLRRGRQLSSFAGGWVFPGGAMDPADGSTEGWESTPTVAKPTAVRELQEETGLTIHPDELVPLSRWIAPVVMPRRFDTWFFLARAPGDRVRIDQGEIHDHRWVSPRQALADHRDGHLALFPPTWVTLHHLAVFQGCDAAIAAAGASLPYHFAPRVVQKGPDTCFLYRGDEAYEHLRIDQPGARHRLWARPDEWQYQYLPAPGPPVDPPPAS